MLNTTPTMSNWKEEIMKRVEEIFGKHKFMIYSSGFRYLENFENYSQVFPGSSVHNYIDDSKYIT